MNFIKLNLAVVMALTSTALMAELGSPCSSPASESVYFVGGAPVEPSLLTIEELPGMSDAIVAAETGNAISTTASLVVSGISQVAQGARGNSIFQIASCKNASTAQGSLSWMDSPTRLSLGNSPLQYDLGALVGNWALLGGTAAAWSLAANRFGTATARFPGGLTMPVLFLMGPLSMSAVSLLRDGTVTQQLLGGCSLTAQILGTGLVAVFLHPCHFSARWTTEDDGSKWIDGHEKNYVKHYGMLFKDYREGRHWFITGELLTSIALGSVKSYLAVEGNCRPVVTSAAAISLGYALSMVFLRPNVEPGERVFYGVVSSAMATALTLQAASLWSTSEDTQQKTRAIAQSVVMAAEWALFAKSLYDVARRLGSFYHYLRSKPDQTPLLSAPLLPAEAAQQHAVNVGKARSPELFMPDALPSANEAAVLEVPVPAGSPLKPDSLWVDPNNPNPLNEITAAQEGLL